MLAPHWSALNNNEMGHRGQAEQRTKGRRLLDPAKGRMEQLDYHQQERPRRDHQAERAARRGHTQGWVHTTGLNLVRNEAVRLGGDFHLLPVGEHPYEDYIRRLEPMADVVFILGAGASLDSGAPLMRGFFDRAKNLLIDRRSKLGETRAAALQAVFDVRRELQALHSKTWLDLGNIEEVFAFLEMRMLLEPTPEHEQQVRNLETLIAATLELSVQFHVASRDSHPEASAAYIGLRRIIAGLHSRQRSVACITFNYDLALEQALSQPWDQKGSTEDFDYCLGHLGDEGIPLLKLHGSLNWFRCPDCRQIVAVSQRGQFSFEAAGQYRAAIKLPTNWPSHRTEGGGNCSNNKEHIAIENPVLVPPTWNKHGRYSQILPVWQRAVRELQGASDIIVIGYSLPPSDIFSIT